MTWFKSLIMRQNSPLLLINSNQRFHKGNENVPEEEDPSSSNNKRSSRRTQVRYNININNNDDRLLESQQQKTQSPEPTSFINRLPDLVSFSTTTTLMPASQQTDRQHQELPTATKTRKTHQLIKTTATTTTTTNVDSLKNTIRSQRISPSNSKEFKRRRPQHFYNKQKVDFPLVANQKLKVKNPPPTSCQFVFLNQKENSKRRMKRDQEQLILLASFLLATFFSLSLLIKQINCATQQQYFEIQPERQYLAQNGQDLRLRCIIRNRQGECLWIHNGKALGPLGKKYQYIKSPEDGDCSIMIRNVSVHQDNGGWQCQVLASDPDLDNSLQSNEVDVVVLVAPERPQIKNMTQGTHKLIMEENKQRFIVCEIRGGNPAPQIEWFLDNKNITKEAQLFVAEKAASGPLNLSQRITQSRLKMNDIKRSMNGKNLTCVGVHPIINQSNTAELDVQYLPTVSVVQREYSIVEGSPLSINCQVDSNPPPSIISWRSATVGGGSTQAPSLGQKSGPVLEFDRISRDYNQNIFECMAQNIYGVSVPVDVKLNVLYAPFLLNTSNSESVVVGHQVTLGCVFEGNPEPEVKWYYTDPLSRTAVAHLLENQKQQYLVVKNATYRNEGDYHCEARNQINGVYYGVRSSNIVLDVFGEPQFLVKTPLHAKAVQGSKSDIALTFCSDPPPNKVYWQFGSLRLDVRLSNGGGQQQPANGNPVALPGGPKQTSAVHSRYQAQPLQPLQKRDTFFSRTPTCFEAQLSIMDPDVIDQRDYTLMVQNERGHQAAVVRLRVTAPLSPGLMISSALGTIIVLFLIGGLVTIVVRKRQKSLSASQRANGSDRGPANGAGGQTNQNGTNQNGGTKTITRNGGLLAGEKNGVEHLVNGSGNAAAINAQQQLLMQQQTRNGIVNGTGNGVANGASNPANNGSNQLVVDHVEKSAALNMMSMASSDTSGDQKQLLSNSSDRNSSASGSTTNHCLDSHLVHHHSNYSNLHHPHHHHQHHHANNNNSNVHSPTSISHSSSMVRTADDEDDNISNDHSTSSPMNHLSVDEELQHNNTNLTYQAGESISPNHLHNHNHLNQASQFSAKDGGLIYANLDYPQQEYNNPNPLLVKNNLQASSPTVSTTFSQQQQHQLDGSISNDNNSQSNSIIQTTPGTLSSNNNNNFNTSSNSSIIQAGTNGSPRGIRSSVGATIAMMNSLAAAASVANQVPSQPGAGVLNGAINQQLANSRQIRKPGPPKPPKPSIQQRSRFYQQQQQQQQQQQSSGNNNGLVMIGSLAGNDSHLIKEPTANELAVEYSRIAFPARAEL